MIASINSVARKYASLSPITNVYGLSRALLALGTLLTLCFNGTDTLFYGYAGKQQSFSLFIQKTNLYALLGYANLGLAKGLSICVLILVISGWRPRFTGILHWWVTFSFATMTTSYDGGDQIAVVLTLLLIPVCLLDNRINHWYSFPDDDRPKGSLSYTHLFLWSIFTVIRIQVAIIYLHAGIAKMSKEEWINGTATYYWFTHSYFGASPSILPFIYWIMSIPFVVVLITWGTQIFELILGMVVFMTRTKYNWKIFLTLGISFHFGIILIHGLISFFFAITAALVLYLYPVHYHISCPMMNRLKYLKLNKHYGKKPAQGKGTSPAT